MNRPKPPRYGFRFDWIDAVIILAGLLLTVLFYFLKPLLAIIPIFAVGHFFLFCNVFRVAQKLEYLWVLLLLINSAVWGVIKGIDIIAITATQLLVTAVIIALEIRSPRYHGVFSKPSR